VGAGAAGELVPVLLVELVPVLLVELVPGLLPLPPVLLVLLVPGLLPLPPVPVPVSRPASIRSRRACCRCRLPACRRACIGAAEGFMRAVYGLIACILSPPIAPQRPQSAARKQPPRKTDTKKARAGRPACTGIFRAGALFCFAAGHICADRVKYKILQAFPARSRSRTDCRSRLFIRAQCDVVF